MKKKKRKISIKATFSVSPPAASALAAFPAPTNPVRNPLSLASGAEDQPTDALTEERPEGSVQAPVASRTNAAPSPPQLAFASEPPAASAAPANPSKKKMKITTTTTASSKAARVPRRMIEDAEVLKFLREIAAARDANDAPAALAILQELGDKKYMFSRESFTEIE
jgi:hypothetical protein